jgi:hypothetical protein
MKRNYLMWLIGGAALYFLTRKKETVTTTTTTTSDVGNQVNDAAPAQSAPKQSATTGSSTPYVELVGEAGNRPEGV